MCRARKVKADDQQASTIQKLTLQNQNKVKGGQILCVNLLNSGESRLEYFRERKLVLDF